MKRLIVWVLLCIIGRLICSADFSTGLGVWIVGSAALLSDDTHATKKYLWRLLAVLERPDEA